MHRKIQVERAWRRDLENAAILVGQSLNSSDVATSFMLNMIALELLLTQKGDKYSSELPKRVEAFLGWVGFWSSQNYEEKIKFIYKKRCELVHRGRREKIAKEDLLFTDDLILNLFINIVSLPNIFDSKNKIIEFANKVEAEHILGLKSRVRPKKLTFVSPNYSKEDLNEV
jgi:hypothetical protein